MERKSERLAKVDRLIAAARLKLAKQREIVSKLAGNGPEIILAQKKLETYINVQDVLEKERQQIVAELLAVKRKP